jgi:hypothetical protein
MRERMAARGQQGGRTLLLLSILLRLLSILLRLLSILLRLLLVLLLGLVRHGLLPIHLLVHRLLDHHGLLHHHRLLHHHHRLLHLKGA